MHIPVLSMPLALPVQASAGIVATPLQCCVCARSDDCHLRTGDFHEDGYPSHQRRLMALGGITLAQAQGNPVQGSPGSTFPRAARHEIQMICGIPCRTVLVKGTHIRVPVECAGQATTGTFDPNATGGIHVEAATASAMSHSPEIERTRALVAPRSGGLGR